MKGFLSHIDKVLEYLPPDATGWMRTHSILIHPQTMDILGVMPRQAVRVKTPTGVFIGVLWPCKELGILRMCITAKDAPKEKMASIEPLWKTFNVPRIVVSLKGITVKADDALREYLEMYLSNAYVQPGISIPINYYGGMVEIIPEMPIEQSLETLSLKDESTEFNDIVFFVTYGCSVFITGLNGGQSCLPLEPMDLSSVGGMHNAKKTLMDYVILPFMREGSCCSVLMWGLPGSGKTLLLSTMARILSSSAFYFQSMDEFNEQYAFIQPKSIVILDWPSVEKDHKGYTKLTQLLSNGKTASVILSIRQADDLELGVRVRFPIEMEVEVPTEAERIEILSILADYPSDQNLIELAKFILFISFPYYFFLICSHCYNSITERCQIKAVIWPQKHRSAFERFGIDPPAGILLYGPPGCSKTLVARALANESKMNFLAVKGPELFSKWVGESEKAIRDLFSRARQVAPTIVFFDEIDAVGASRGSEKSSGVSDRVLAQLLTELDGLEKQSGVILLAATNRPDHLDSALLRPGRLDRALYVGLPSASTRRAILTMRTKKMAMAEDVSIDCLVDRTKGYSGAELVAVCRNAALIAMRENIDAVEVHWGHFEETLRAIVPRTEKYLLDIYEQFKQGCISG
uniref:AAA domain-containing protein n=1 Tax=Heterorhabditis bacteriophora TaxID=37862 RepID=A0A1I7XRT7_HETBA